MARGALAGAFSASPSIALCSRSLSNRKIIFTIYIGLSLVLSPVPFSAVHLIDCIRTSRSIEGRSDEDVVAETARVRNDAMAATNNEIAVLDLEKQYQMESKGCCQQAAWKVAVAGVR